MYPGQRASTLSGYKHGNIGQTAQTAEVCTQDSVLQHYLDISMEILDRQPRLLKYVPRTACLNIKHENKYKQQQGVFCMNFPNTYHATLNSSSDANPLITERVHHRVRLFALNEGNFVIFSSPHYKSQATDSRQSHPITHY